MLDLTAHIRLSVFDIQKIAGRVKDGDSKLVSCCLGYRLLIP
jgi:hypothetical protein